MIARCNLNNKNAVITGGGGFLGYEHAAALLELNATVYLLDINYQSLKKNYNKLKSKFNKERIKIFHVDITKESKLLKLSTKFIKQKIIINILINNAAIDAKVSKKKNNFIKFEKLTLDMWEKEMNVGLTGAFLCTKIFGREMAKNKHGVILNISSDLSVISPDHRLYNLNSKKIKYTKPVTYSVIKHGLIGLTKYISTYWAKDGIRCNALSPGSVENNQNSAFLKKIKNLIPLNRLAKREEYKGAVQFLCAESSSYMTGQNLIIDGGRSVW